jgi:integrase
VASIERRERGGKITWRARYRDPSGRQCNKSFARKADARAYLATVESRKLEGSYVDPNRSNVTVADFARQYMAGKINLKPTTRAAYESIISVHIVPRWGNVQLGRVTHGDIQAWLGELVGAGMSPGLVRKVSVVLSGMLGLAVKDRRIPTNPALGVDLPRVVARRRQYLTTEQVEMLANAAGAHDRQYRLAVLTLAYCGLRWGELAALRVCRVDLMRRRLNVAESMTEVDGKLYFGTPKTHEARSVPLPAFLADELAIYLAGRSATDFVFTSAKGYPLRNRGARKAWFDAAAESAGLAGLTPHELRHTAASLAVSADANVKALQRMLGHASAVMTLDVYSDLFDDDLDGVANRLDALRSAVVSCMVPSASVVNLDARRQTPTGQQISV